MRLSIVGSGYVGLVTGACLAESGHEVICVDNDPRKVEMINAAQAPMHEQGLVELLERNVGRRLHATSDLGEAVSTSEVTFIAVATPAAHGQIDLRFIEQATQAVGNALRAQSAYHTVIVKSTVVPGTTTGLVRRILEQASGQTAGTDFGLGMNPEFLTEGTAVADFSHPDRLVLGGIDDRTHETLRRIYADIDADTPRIVTTPTTAELIKYASNAVLATMISFSNEIAQLCTVLDDVDALDVLRGVHQSSYFTSRFGNERRAAAITSFLTPGCGFGGSCLPKDVTALIGHAQEHGLALDLLHSVLEVNRSRACETIDLLSRHVECLRDAPVTVLGLAFKPDTDDVRESPAFPIIRELKARGASVTAYDPVARPAHDDALLGVTLADSLEEAVADAAVVVLVTSWAEFSHLPQVLNKLGRAPLVVDGRRTLDPQAFERYAGIGRSSETGSDRRRGARGLRQLRAM